MNFEGHREPSHGANVNKMIFEQDFASAISRQDARTQAQTATDVMDRMMRDQEGRAKRPRELDLASHDRYKPRKERKGRGERPYADFAPSIRQPTRGAMKGMMWETGVGAAAGGIPTAETVQALNAMGKKTKKQRYESNKVKLRGMGKVGSFGDFVKYSKSKK